MSRNTPRRSSSRSSTSRPRRLAGQRPAAEPGDASKTEERIGPDEPDTEAEAGADTDTDAPPEPAAPEADAPDADASDVEGQDGDEGSEGQDDRPAGVLSGERTTRILIGVMVVVTVLLLGQGAWWVVHSVRDDPAPDVPDGEIAVPSGRPVVMGEVAWREGVDAAAEAATTVVARDYEKYDAEVDEATALMTPAFAEEYRQITSDIKREFVDQETVVEVRVVGQGVVRANQTELQALVFLNQYTTKGPAKDSETTYAPYRAVLTMVHTDEGWLVDDIQTK